MPVPKGKQELYGKIAGHMQNLGKSLSEAKDIADAAVTPGSQRSGHSSGSSDSAKASKSRSKENRKDSRNAAQKVKSLKWNQKF